LRVGNTAVNVKRGVLENASGAESALFRTVNEVLTNRGKVLLVQVLFALKFFFPMREAASNPVS